MMMNGGRPLPKHSFPTSPCGCRGGRQGNLSVTIYTRGAPSWVSGFATRSWRLPLLSRLLSQAGSVKAPSRHVKGWKLPRETDGEDRNYREIGAKKWALRMLLTWEHAGILPNQSNPPKLTPFARHPMIPHWTPVPPTHGSALREPPSENLWLGGSSWQTFSKLL